ncbi:hypothetical protein GUJ93_ZPchr0005g14608 [Zizania palustris]|uniref:Uncharacterized protein n=1 Tax=Zizania palustris TaxID=103762 RepID=A0A8J5STH1_ZIZPA|nr:hypothetical protein GUJ93_ZPchr0005g14608 [Zizania palustris]
MARLYPHKWPVPASTCTARHPTDPPGLASLLLSCKRPACPDPGAYHPLDAIHLPIVPLPMASLRTPLNPLGSSTLCSGGGLATRGARSCYRFRTDDGGVVDVAVSGKEGDDGRAELSFDARRSLFFLSFLL